MKSAKIVETNKKARCQNDAKEDAKSAKENVQIRCPFCIEEGVMVPATDMKYTDNVVRTKLRLRPSSFSTGGDIESANSEDETKKKQKDNISKAQKSALKWGGGYATKKKEKGNFSRRPY